MLLLLTQPHTCTLSLKAYFFPAVCASHLVLAHAVKDASAPASDAAQSQKNSSGDLQKYVYVGFYKEDENTSSL